MKLLYLLPFLMLISCTSGSKETLQNTHSSREADSIRQVVMPVLKGVWLKKDYAESILKTKSPSESSKLLVGAVTLIIKDSDQATDSTNVGISINNHEGSEFWIYFRKGIKPGSIPTSYEDFQSENDFFELYYKIRSKDTVLSLNRYSNNKKLLSSVSYIKVLPKPIDNDAAEGLKFYVLKNLFQGAYELRDSSNVVISEVTMESSGRMTGLEDYHHYDVITDFVQAIDANNVIIFRRKKEDYINFKIFLYSFSGDTLNLYQAIGAEELDDVPLRRGNKVYSFIRK